ncbi:MAG: SOS response-associated peptidase [Actinophytocola sp.]|nr:SOS response-associated peptidase [Actinophytocola sp.]
MCGRYAATKDPATLVKEFDAADDIGDHQPTPDHNVAPTRKVMAVLARHPKDADGEADQAAPAERLLRVMRWGLIPFWAKDAAIGNRMINTRAETAASKPAFRSALKRHRCLLPADGWFEWRRGPAKGQKQPFFMTTTDGSSLAFAGIWETWRDPKADSDAPKIVSCSVLTTDAVGSITDVHDRMPLLMPREQWSRWLDPDLEDVMEMLEPPPLSMVDSLELRPVSDKVNNVRNNGPELLERVEPAADLDDPALFDPQALDSR